MPVYTVEVVFLFPWQLHVQDIPENYLYLTFAQICNFPKEKKYSAEHRKDENFDLFRRNSVCIADEKTLGIIHRRGKQSELCNYVLNHSEEDKKCSKFRSEQFRRIGRKTLKISFLTIKRKKFILETRSKLSKEKEKNIRMIFKKHFFAEFFFRSEPQNGLFQDIRNSAKGALFSAV